MVAGGSTSSLAWFAIGICVVASFACNIVKQQTPSTINKIPERISMPPTNICMRHDPVWVKSPPPTPWTLTAVRQVIVGDVGDLSDKNDMTAEDDGDWLAVASKIT